MSASPQKRPNTAVPRHGAMCQQATFAPQQNNPLFNHLVGAGEQHGWHGKAECSGCLEVDDEIEFGGLLHGKIARLLTTKNSINVLCHSSECICQVVSVGDEPASLDGTSVGEERRQSMPQRQGDDEVVTDVCMRKDNNATVLLRREGRNDTFDFGRTVDCAALNLG